MSSYNKSFLLLEKKIYMLAGYIILAEKFKNSTSRIHNNSIWSDEKKLRLD